MHEKRAYKYHCDVCKSKLQKRGLTAAGTQRWFCPKCSASSTKGRSDLSRGYVLENFVDWLAGKDSQGELGGSARTFRDKTEWCWDVRPPSKLTGEIHHAIIVDGIVVGNQVCLIARTTNFVICWIWVPYENSANWSRLFVMFPPPKYVVCDGQKGLIKALNICWPSVVIQRCRFHVWLNVKARLTLRPESKAGRELLKLTRDLLHVRTRRRARRWKRDLKRWYKRHEGYVNARTIDPNPRKHKRKWRYTHEKLRSAYRQLNRQTDDLLRSSYRPHSELPGTTNHLEGGINSPIRRLLNYHRGMPQQHQMRLVDWYLYGRTENPKPPRKCL